MSVDLMLNVEASKLVKEFSTWMIAIQSAAIGFLLKGRITAAMPLV